MFEELFNKQHYSDFETATALKSVYPEYACASIKDKIWFVRIGNKWEQSSMEFMNKVLFNELLEECETEKERLLIDHKKCGDGYCKSILSSSIINLTDAIKNYSTKAFRNRVIYEWAYIAHDPEFVKKHNLTMYPSLLPLALARIGYVKKK